MTHVIEMVPMAHQKSHNGEEEELREQQLHFATARRREFNSQLVVTSDQMMFN